LVAMAQRISPFDRNRYRRKPPWASGPITSNRSMTPTSPWAVQRRAADCLGISERTLHRWRAAGLLQPGDHYRRKFPNPNSPLLYHLERCERAMAEACARHPGRLELAPERSSQATKRSLELVQAPSITASSRHLLPPTSARSPQRQPGEDAEPLAHGGIDAAAGPIAEDGGGIKGRLGRGGGAAGGLARGAACRAGRLPGRGQPGRAHTA
jgi:hypothetical protein